MKNKIKFLKSIFILLSFVGFICLFNINKSFANDRLYTKIIPVLDLVYENEVSDNLSFQLTQGEELIDISSNNGELVLKLKQNTSYILSLNEENYVMNPLSFTFKELDGFLDAYSNETDGNIFSLFVQKKYTLDPMKVMSETSGEFVQDELTFRFFNIDKNEFLGDFKTQNGVLQNITLDDSDSYLVTLLENEKYQMQDYRIYAFMNGLPSNENDSDRIFDYFTVKEKPKNPKPLYQTVFLPLTEITSSGNVEISDELEFEITGNGETITVSKDDRGMYKLRLLVGENYTANLVANDKYQMQEFTFGAVKDESGFVSIMNKTIDDMLLSFAVTKKQPKPILTTLYLKVQQNNIDISDALEFEIIGNNESFRVLSQNGEVQLRKIKVGVDYSVRLIENEKYSMDSFEFSVIKDENNFFTPTKKSDNSLLVSFDVIKKGSNSSISNQNNNSDECNVCNTNTKVTISEIPITLKGSNDLVVDDVVFEFYNLSMQKLLGTFTATNGKLPQIEINANDWYGVTLKSQNYRMDKKYIYAFANGFPIDAKDENERPIVKFEIENKTANTIDEEERFALKLPVVFEGEVVNESVVFEFISDDETVTAISKDGMLETRLREHINYMVRIVKNDKYDIEMFPLTMKDKGEYGMNPYDHRDCNIVEELNLIKKGTEVKTTIAKSSPTDPIVTVEGYDFRDLRLSVEKITKEISSLANYDYQVYDIKFINDYRKEVAKLNNIDFIVTVKKDKPNNVTKNVYYLSESGVLEEKEIIRQDNNYVTFKTTHFSEYVLVYSNEEINDNNSIYTPVGSPKYVIKDETKTTTVTGTNFAGLELIVNKLNKNDLPVLQYYKADLYEVKFVDSNKNNVTLENKKYQIIMPKEMNTDIMAVYFISKNNEILPLENVTYGCETVTFNSNIFNKFAIVYNSLSKPDESNNETISNNSNSVKPENENVANNSTKPVSNGVITANDKNNVTNNIDNKNTNNKSEKNIPSLPLPKNNTPKKAVCDSTNPNSECANPNVIHNTNGIFSSISSNKEKEISNNETTKQSNHTTVQTESNNSQTSNNGLGIVKNILNLNKQKNQNDDSNDVIANSGSTTQDTNNEVENTNSKNTSTSASTSQSTTTNTKKSDTNTITQSNANLKKAEVSNNKNNFSIYLVASIPAIISIGFIFRKRLGL